MTPCAAVRDYSPHQPTLLALWLLMDGEAVAGHRPAFCGRRLARPHRSHRPQALHVDNLVRTPRGSPFWVARPVSYQKVVLAAGPRGCYTARPQLQTMLLQLLHVLAYVEQALKHRQLRAPHATKAPERHHGSANPPKTALQHDATGKQGVQQVDGLSQHSRSHPQRQHLPGMAMA